MTWIDGWVVEGRQFDGSGPGFSRYTQEDFFRLRRQHNIMVFVCNGFDLQVAHDYDRGIDSRYETFYHYLKMRGIHDNSIVQELEAELKLHQEEGGHGDWSDIEAALARRIARGWGREGELLSELQLIQAEFAQFLQSVAPSELLDKLGDDAATQGCPSVSSPAVLKSGANWLVPHC